MYNNTERDSIQHSTEDIARKDVDKKVTNGAKEVKQSSYNLT